MRGKTWDPQIGAKEVMKRMIYRFEFSIYSFPT
jgi:hypothetical protein